MASGKGLGILKLFTKISILNGISSSHPNARFQVKIHQEKNIQTGFQKKLQKYENLTILNKVEGFGTSIVKTPSKESLEVPEICDFLAQMCLDKRGND